MIFPSLIGIVVIGCLINACMGFLISPAPRRNLPILYYKEEFAQDTSVVKVPSRNDLARVDISEDTNIAFLSDIKRFSDLTNEWITLETTFLPKVYSDYPGDDCDDPNDIHQSTMLFDYCGMCIYF